MTEIHSQYFNNLECAFQILFSQAFTDEEEIANALSSYDGEELPVVNVSKVRDIVSGVTEHQLAIDSTITKYLRNWTLQRLNRVDLTLLRIAIYEMSYVETPKFPALIINNAVELAKLYGTDASYRFVNAVLDNYYKKECQDA